MHFKRLLRSCTWWIKWESFWSLTSKKLNKKIYGPEKLSFTINMGNYYSYIWSWNSNTEKALCNVSVWEKSTKSVFDAQIYKTVRFWWRNPQSSIFFANSLKSSLLKVGECAANCDAACSGGRSHIFLFIFLFKICIHK